MQIALEKPSAYVWYRQKTCSHCINIVGIKLTTFIMKGVDVEPILETGIDKRSACSTCSTGSDHWAQII